MHNSTAQALLFDVGGVVVDIDFNRALRAWSAHSLLSPDELKRRFQFDTAYERHERGEIEANDYFDHLASTLQLTATREDIASGWNAIFVAEITATRRLVEAARTTLPCYAFTNTNASHLACWTRLFPEVVAAFDGIFASHQIGLRKPELAAFEHICRATDIPAESFLFFDDLPENVHAASEAGLQAVLVRCPADVARALRGLGCNLGDR